MSSWMVFSIFEFNLANCELKSYYSILIPHYLTLLDLYDGDHVCLQLEVEHCGVRLKSLQYGLLEW